MYPKTASQYCTQTERPDEGGDFIDSDSAARFAPPVRVGGQKFLAREAVNAHVAGVAGVEPPRFAPSSPFSQPPASGRGDKVIERRAQAQRSRCAKAAKRPQALHSLP